MQREAINAENRHRKDSGAADRVLSQEFARSFRDAKSRSIGDAAGLTQFGVNITRIKAGAASALRHWHEEEDEFIYMLEGELVLQENGGETVLKPGDAAGFKAGSGERPLPAQSHCPRCGLSRGRDAGEERARALSRRRLHDGARRRPAAAFFASPVSRFRVEARGTTVPKIDIANATSAPRASIRSLGAAITDGREKAALGNVAGLTQFGVNLTRLKPGAASALRHWHEAEDEFVYVLEGEITLIEDGGETVLRAGRRGGLQGRRRQRPSPRQQVLARCALSRGRHARQARARALSRRRPRQREGRATDCASRTDRASLTRRSLEP